MSGETDGPPTGLLDPMPDENYAPGAVELHPASSGGVAAPSFLDVSLEVTGNIMLPFEQWAAAKKTQPADLEQARVYHRWAQGREMTEAAFDAALEATRKLVFR